MNRFFLILIFLSVWFPVKAQTQENSQPWTLQQCIDYAVEHNIDIQQRVLQKDNAEVQLGMSRMNRLPNLNAGVGQSWSVGRSNNTQTGLYEDKTISNANLYVQSSVPIFTGTRINNEIARDKLNLQAALNNLEGAKEDLSLNVMSYYLEALFNKELLKIAEEQLSLSQVQLVQTEALADAGKIALSQLSDVRAQVADDKVKVTEATHQVKLSLLVLAQSLDLVNIEGFDIVGLTEENADDWKIAVIPSQVYDNAVAEKPHIKEQEYLLASSKKSLRVAQSGYMPQLSMSLQYGNNYYYDYQSATNTTFNDQIRVNGGETVGLNLNIPIFNRLQTRGQVKKARLNIHNQQLTLENTKRLLYKDIQTAYLNAVAAREKYLSTSEAVEASAEAFRQAEERYNVGKFSVYEYNEAKNRLIKSLGDQVQSKYDYIYRMKILDYYNGVALTKL